MSNKVLRPKKASLYQLTQRIIPKILITVLNSSNLISGLVAFNVTVVDATAAFTAFRQYFSELQASIRCISFL